MMTGIHLKRGQVCYSLEILGTLPLNMRQEYDLVKDGNDTIPTQSLY